jgi:glycosyltransferase involved in cell wall biosynthesis
VRVGVVTSLPDGTECRKSGIAYYSQAVLEPLEDTVDDEIVVFADGLGEEAEESRGNLHVVRCWRFGHLAPFQILRAVLAADVEALHVEYDVYLYGGVVAAFVLPFVLRFVGAIRNIPVTVTMHGVVPRRNVTRTMLKENGFVLPFTWIGRFGFTAMYELFDWASTRIVVLEPALAQTLANDYGVSPAKLYCVPIPLMHDGTRPTREEARARCNVNGARMILYFGYASYYKGLDVAIEAFERLRESWPDVELHLIASRHPRRNGDPRYEAYYEALRERAAAAGAALHDFVPEQRLVDMLAAADVVVLPYIGAYGASAALNTAIAARRPVLASTFVRFDGALPCQIFEPNARACEAALRAFFSEHRAVLEERTERLARTRGVERIGRMIHEIRCGRIARTA